jgi:hypothetical protein
MAVLPEDSYKKMLYSLLWEAINYSGIAEL